MVLLRRPVSYRSLSSRIVILVRRLRKWRIIWRNVAQGSLSSPPILMAGGFSTAPPKGNVAQGSLSSLAVLPPRRGFDGAAEQV